MTSPTVSVIMASYNHDAFVQQAMESVLSQQGIDFEFLISDDGSSDRTRDVVASIKDARIQFIPNEINRGACIVTNELIEHASGEFIALINSDDYWTDENKLVYQVNIMREKPDVCACFGRVTFVDNGGKAIDKKSLPFGEVFNQKNRSQGQWLRYFFNRGNCICHPTMLIRRSCYEELGMYNNRLRQLPDLDMWVRMVKHYNIFISDRELINFRILPGENASSQTVVNSIRSINEHFLIAEGFFENVTRDQLIEGFSDVLMIKDIPSEQHLDIEKARLLFVDNQWLGKPYKILGLLQMYELLNSPKHHDLMVNDYGMGDCWFQGKMGEVDVFRPRVIEEIKQKTRKFNLNLFKNLFNH